MTNLPNTPEATEVPAVPARLTYGNAVIDTPEYAALHAQAVAEGVLHADAKPERIALVKGQWHVIN